MLRRDECRSLFVAPTVDERWSIAEDRAIAQRIVKDLGVETAMTWVIRPGKPWAKMMQHELRLHDWRRCQ